MDEDMILPDDFTETPSDEVEEEITTETVDSIESMDEVTKPTEDVEATQEPVQTEEQQPQKIKIKFNHEEMEIPIEEAAALAQKGMNYEKAIERAKQEAAQQARDKMIAEMGLKTWDGRPIMTEAEYKQEMAERELLQKYQDRDIPEELVKEIIENRRYRESQQREREAQEKQAKEQAQIDEFLEYFMSVNDRPFDGKKDTIPDEVKEAVNKGQPLKYAYMEYHNKELNNRLKIAKQNESNLKKAPVVSVTAGGGTKTESEDPFLIGFNSDY